MNWFVLGGIMMWPLLLLSIMGMAIIVERIIFYRSICFPPKGMEKTLAQVLQHADLELILCCLQASIFCDFCSCIKNNTCLKSNEAALQLNGRAILAKAEAGLSLLGMISRLAPLIGLLGTILGMIQTFSRIASTHGAVDMPLLAGGIWQALITTASGLIIAVPIVFARHFFMRRKAKIAAALESIGNTVLVLRAATGAARQV
ncbi:MAG: MotA/TolQ/ExbB proton channel family protein [Desulfomicrobium sp.]|jgi:biopolymer transport protein ExbB|nr:MotA/TolQ/ExbB proton channel family protein [Desulfomicrobium sp.]NLW04891.1 MotA/TolQ/ExbB proton channel family protein [Pseudomonadaceae bacterium]